MVNSPSRSSTAPTDAHVHATPIRTAPSLSRTRTRRAMKCVRSFYRTGAEARPSTGRRFVDRDPGHVVLPGLAGRAAVGALLRWRAAARSSPAGAWCHGLGTVSRTRWLAWTPAMTVEGACRGDQPPDVTTSRVQPGRLRTRRSPTNQRSKLVPISHRARWHLCRPGAEREALVRVSHSEQSKHPIRVRRAMSGALS